MANTTSSCVPHVMAAGSPSCPRTMVPGKKSQATCQRGSMTAQQPLAPGVSNVQERTVSVTLWESALPLHSASQTVGKLKRSDAAGVVYKMTGSGWL